MKQFVQQDKHHSRLEVFGVQALGAAQEAIRKFEAASTPWQRPPDYYAEMVKNDDHMAKVKQQLMHEQEQMEAVEQRWDLLLAAADASTLLLVSNACQYITGTAFYPYLVIELSM